MASDRTRMGRHVAARVDEDFGTVLLDTAVPRTTRLSEMALRGKPAVIYDRRSPGSRAYFDLADEMVQRYTVAEAPWSTATRNRAAPGRLDPRPADGDSGRGGSAGTVLLDRGAAADGLERFLPRSAADPDGPGSALSRARRGACGARRWSPWTTCWPKRSRPYDPGEPQGWDERLTGPTTANDLRHPELVTGPRDHGDRPGQPAGPAAHPGPGGGPPLTAETMTLPGLRQVHHALGQVRGASSAQVMPAPVLDRDASIPATPTSHRQGHLRRLLRQRPRHLEPHRLQGHDLRQPQARRRRTAHHRPRDGGRDRRGRARACAARYGYRPKDIVSTESHIICGTCYQCRIGQTHICART